MLTLFYIEFEDFEECTVLVDIKTITHISEDKSLSGCFVHLKSGAEIHLPMGPKECLAQIVQVVRECVDKLNGGDNESGQTEH
jgi:hypothetical protein